MIDPVTAIGLATTAFNGIKSAIGAGRDIQDMAGQLGQWGKAISDLYTNNKYDVIGMSRSNVFDLVHDQEKI